MNHLATHKFVYFLSFLDLSPKKDVLLVGRLKFQFATLTVRSGKYQNATQKKYIDLENFCLAPSVVLVLWWMWEFEDVYMTGWTGGDPVVYS